MDKKETKNVKKATTKKSGATSKKVVKEVEEKPIATKIDIKETKVEEKKGVPANKEVKFVVKEPNFFEKYGKTIASFVFGILVGLFVMYIAKYNVVATLSSGEEIAASINGKDFTANALYEKLKDSYGNSALIEMIDDELLNKAYTDEEVKEDVDAEITYYKEYYGEDWDNVIKTSTYKTEENFRNIIGLSYKQELAIADYIKENLVTDDEVQKYYDDTIKADIKVSHIIIQSDADANASEDEKKKALEEAKEKTEKLIKELKDEKDVTKRLELFAKLAKENSSDGTAESGGDLGYITYKDDMDEAFLAAAFALGSEVGSYTTTPVESSFGYHIIIKTDEDKEKASLDSVKDEILDVLAQEELTKSPELSITAMVEFRNKNGLKFYDQVLKRAYDDYNDAAIESIKSQNSAS